VDGLTDLKDFDSASARIEATPCVFQLSSARGTWPGASLLAVCRVESKRGLAVELCFSLGISAELWSCGTDYKQATSQLF
jgi:hypothetical protein